MQKWWKWQGALEQRDDLSIARHLRKTSPSHCDLCLVKMVKTKAYKLGRKQEILLVAASLTFRTSGKLTSVRRQCFPPKVFFFFFNKAQFCFHIMFLLDIPNYNHPHFLKVWNLWLEKNCSQIFVITFYSPVLPERTLFFLLIISKGENFTLSARINMKERTSPSSCVHLDRSRHRRNPGSQVLVLWCVRKTGSGARNKIVCGTAVRDSHRWMIHFSERQNNHSSYIYLLLFTYFLILRCGSRKY